MQWVNGTLSDGVILLLHKTVTYSVLKRIMTIIRNSKIELIGAIVRESSLRFEKEYEEYLKIIEDKLIEDINKEDINDDSQGIRNMIVEEADEYLNQNERF